MTQRGNQMEGRVFDRLTVIGYSHSSSSGKRFWKCQCSCGNQASVETSKLTGRLVKSCGCKKKEDTAKRNLLAAEKFREEALRDMPGKVFKRLTVVSLLKDSLRAKERVWTCSCSCGAQAEASERGLIDGTVGSCGCLKRKPDLRIDLTGQVFGLLKVLGPGKRDAGGNMQWECQCECGNVIYPRTNALTGNMARTCGCKGKSLKKSHGLSGSPTYGLWLELKRRCYDKSHPSYSEFGGSGIAMCDRWVDDFGTFYEDVGERPGDAVFIRNDINADYSPGNFVWMSLEEHEALVSAHLDEYFSRMNADSLAYLEILMAISKRLDAKEKSK